MWNTHLAPHKPFAIRTVRGHHILFLHKALHKGFRVALTPLITAMKTEDQITGPVFKESEKEHCSRDTDRTQTQWKNPFSKNMQYFYRTFSSNDFQQNDQKRRELLFCMMDNQKKEEVNWYS